MISSGSSGYVRLSELNKHLYASRHNYSLHVLPPVDSSRHPAWSKIPAALSLLPLYDWLWVVDTDTLVMNPSVPLTEYINDAFDMVSTPVAVSALGPARCTRLALLYSVVSTCLLELLP
jgi:hypothetical protein